MQLWLLVIATVIGVFGILVVYKQAMTQIVAAMKMKDYQAVEKAQTSLFIRVALVEILPIILVVLVLIDFV